ncbi:MAG: hypothetical protein L0170_00200, partial [Acidobacteria bacterium]|nr:hypothetical protein [Acidobacteriota bacterium]
MASILPAASLRPIQSLLNEMVDRASTPEMVAGVEARARGRPPRVISYRCRSGKSYPTTLA